MELFVDPANKRGAANLLFEQLRDGIVSGRFASGDRLPPSRELAASLGVSRSTVTTAFARLVAEGFVQGRSGGGSFVTDLHPVRSVAQAPISLTVRHDLVGVLGVHTNTSTPGLASTVPIRFDLRSGRPDPQLFPMGDWRSCLAGAAFRTPPGYGDVGGLPEFRSAVARLIARQRAVLATPDQIVVTSGAQQAIDLALRLVAGPGDRVALENPGYPPVRTLCLLLGIVPVPVTVDREGLVIEEVPHDVKAIYLTPSHQSPTGTTMSLRRRRELLDFADAHGVAVIEDDYDSEYRHVDRPLEPLQMLDRTGRVVYVGTFSKVLSPSLRLGFGVFPESLAASAVALKRVLDAQAPATVQQAMLTFISRGHLDRHLRRTRKVYRERHGMVNDFVSHQVALGRLRVEATNYAGLHAAALLEGRRREVDVAAACARRGVVLGNFAECWMTPDAPEGFVLGFGGVTTSSLQRALTVVAKSLAPPKP